MNLRQELEKLTGKTLATLDRHKRFDVLSVTPKQIMLYIHATSKERKVRWEEIEPAWELLQREGQLTRITIRDQFSEANPAYVAALLAALPSVTHRNTPPSPWQTSHYHALP